MKTKLFITLLLVFASLTSFSQTNSKDNANQNSSCIVNIPDANFKAALLANLEINKNNDSEIQCAEADEFNGELNVAGKNISNFAGIEAFTNITYLNCNSNSMTTLELTHNTALTEIHCSFNGSLTSLNISGLTSVWNISCYNNSLTSLIVSGLTSLIQLECYNNKLSTLDVSTETALNNLFCYDNLLTSLDVSSNKDLSFFHCYNNLLTSIDISHNTSLLELNCNHNSLTSLNMKNGNNGNIQTLDARDNTNLTCIQVDDAAYSTERWSEDNIDAWASFSEMCSWCTVSIPDVNFKNALLANPGIDANSDGKIQCTEAAAWTGTIQVSGKNISNITGIEAFKNAKRLYCTGNLITTLDLSSNKALISLDCSTNLLTNLNITGLTSLGELYCENNQLTSLNVSSNTALIAIRCTNNHLTSIDVSTCLLLRQLTCNSNTLSNLDISFNTALNNLDCQSNSLTSLNVKNGNNTGISNFNATNNPGLSCIQVDDAVYSATHWFGKDATASYSETDCGIVTEMTEASNMALKVYPNPISDELIIEVENLNKNTSFEIINSVGMLISAGKLMPKTRVQTSHFPIGIYLLKVENGKTFEIRKIVKK